MASSILSFDIASFLIACLLLSSEVKAFRKYGSHSGSRESENNATPLASRIRKLPPRYSQHYFSPFQPIQTESKTHVSVPSNPANFFGPQSYWAQVANRLIDNVVGTVGGAYAKSRGSAEKLENFRKAPQKENSTRLQYHPLPEFKQKGSKEKSSELYEVSMDANRPSLSASWHNHRIQYTDREGKVISSAEIVQPTTSTRAPVMSVTTSLPNQAPSEYGVLPTLLLRNPNARSKFYHLDKYANPQYPPATKRKFYSSSQASNEYIRDSAFYRTPETEVRRKPVRLSSAGYYGDESRDHGSQEIKFRSALKQILADFRRQHPLPLTRGGGRSRELSYLAQQKGSQSNRRRRPQSRRIVHLPARYGSSDDFLRWRI